MLTGSPRGLTAGVSVTRLGLQGSGANRLGGDVNGDGYSDYVGVQNISDDKGPYRVAVHLGSASGVAAEPSLHLDTGEEAWGLGCTIDTRGDFDGDGVNDIAVGAYRSPTTQPKTGSKVHLGQGSVYVWRGGKHIETAPNWNSASPAKDLAKRKDTAFGVALAVKDANGDGIDDLAVEGGLYDCDPGCPGPNSWLFLGGKKGLSTRPTP